MYWYIVTVSIVVYVDQDVNLQHTKKDIVQSLCLPAIGSWTKTSPLYLQLTVSGNMVVGLGSS